MRTHPGPGGTLFVELIGMGVTWMLRPTAQNIRIVQTAHDGGLRIADTQGTTQSFLTFYQSPYGPGYVLVKDSKGAAVGLRANFLHDPAGQARWFRQGGRLFRHQI